MRKLFPSFKKDNEIVYWGADCCSMGSSCTHYRLSASHDNDRQVDDLSMLMIWLLDEFILCDTGNLSLLKWWVMSWDPRAFVCQLTFCQHKPLRGCPRCPGWQLSSLEQKRWCLPSPQELTHFLKHNWSYPSRKPSYVCSIPAAQSVELQCSSRLKSLQ